MWSYTCEGDVARGPSCNKSAAVTHEVRIERITVRVLCSFCVRDGFTLLPMVHLSASDVNAYVCVCWGGMHVYASQLLCSTLKNFGCPLDHKQQPKSPKKTSLDSCCVGLSTF